ncbi:uncharacterized protein LOC143028125 [Oratosquilla oratoria]|uniref:uncharacterized protein LOC143028125 n=1 Tax=Oratosquilla oratoria TaxID=337810 RepID=UPI003F75DA5A
MLEELAAEDSTIFIALTETHLNDAILDAEINIQNFTLFRADRVDRSHGGVALYLREDLAANTEVLTAFSNNTTELLAVHVKKLDLFIATLYRPPNTTEEMFKEVSGKLQSLLNHLPSPYTEVILAGDLNLPIITWPSRNIRGGSINEQRQAMELISLADLAYLKQFIEDPTRGNNILDLSFSNIYDLVHSYEVTKTTIKDIDWDEIRKEIGQSDWTTLFQDKDTEGALDILQRRCFEICKTMVPPKPTNTKKQRKIIPRDRKNLMKRRIKLRVKFQKTIHLPTTTNIQSELEEIERKLIQSHKNQRAQEELRAISNIQINSKFFYAYANKKLKSTPTIGPLINPAGELESDPTKMAELLKLQYESVFSQPKDHMKVIDPHTFFNEPQVTPHQLSSVEISTEEIIVAINKIAPNAAAGPDGFHAQLLKNCKHQLALPLKLLWNMSL